MNPGEIVLIKFPFTDLESTKKRPALVVQHTKLSPKIQMCIVAMVTSKIDGLKFPGDVLLKEWKNAGLLNPSIVRLSKLVTVDFPLIDQKLGSLGKSDLSAVSLELNKQFSFWLK